MKNKMKARLVTLKEEYQKGEERLLALEDELVNLKSSMLRISGAIQVLGEMLAEDGVDSENGTEPPRMATDHEGRATE